MEQVQNRSLTIVERSTEIFKTAPAVLAENQETRDKAVGVGDKILADIASVGMSPEMDERADKYLVNCKKAVARMEESRKPITQIMTEVAKMFTSAENDLDVSNKSSRAYMIQQQRNAYAKKVAEENELKRKEAERAANIGREQAEAKAEIEKQLALFFNDVLSAAKKKMNDSFNSFTLETIDDRTAKLRDLQPAYEFSSHRSFSPVVRVVYMTPKELEDMTVEILKESFPAYNSQYVAELSLVKSNLLDRVESKRSELIQLREAGEAERKRIEEEIAARQKQEQEALAAQAQQAAKEAEEKANIAKSAAVAGSLFDTAAVIDPEPASKKSLVVDVLNKPGWVEIFQFWYQREGVKADVTLEDMGKKSLNQMKTFVEKMANKEGVKIESKNITYREVIEAKVSRVKG